MIIFWNGMVIKYIYLRVNFLYVIVNSGVFNVLLKVGLLIRICFLDVIVFEFKCKIDYYFYMWKFFCVLIFML